MRCNMADPPTGYGADHHGGQAMSDCTERHPAGPDNGTVGEGQKRTLKAGTA